MVKSAKGVEINMEAIRESNPTTIALGNARMNARGDLLGAGGKILKTKEQLAREYHDTLGSSTVKQVPLSSTSSELQEPSQTQIKNSKSVKIKKETE